ncbi:hypothetical protein NLJ89_g10081 [Agrocybe chaxingu]|uniref:F-BAR domain-containing protein n=1 Tax=Agrocybe chaxingu TaxID=84603 RepID=A0A9W8JRF6_9AGAR|nr:hypothetical protein NLJ89_g10081 [Agrocybe chaxingu]
MRGATRTMEELKNFWKERAVIEEDYAKRLAKLSKMTLGRDEIGDLRVSLDTVRSEIERQAGFHLNLSQQIRTELEVPTAAFHSRQLQHKKTYQTGIEKEFKTKQTQESYVNKAREKYEQDCVRINAFTAQATLVQGKDLEKINLKLERTQQTVQTNEREFANFAKALQDTVQKWETDWKGFCDSCQDMEEDRMEFMKDNIWTYANAVSTVCVADDESCEKIRLALEQMEPEKDMESFVRDYGTGNQIPDPPTFVNYQEPDAIPSSSARPTSRPASFARSTHRELPIRQQSLPPEEEPIINAAGIGAGGGGGGRRVDPYIQDTPGPSRSDTRNSQQVSQLPYTNGTNGYYPHPGAGSSPSSASAPLSQQQVHRQSTTSTQYSQQQQLQRVLQDPHADPIDPTAETYIKVGANAYKVDLTKDPQQQGPSNVRHSTSSPVSPAKPVGGGVDPLMRQLEELQHAVSASGSVRRNTLIKPKPSTGPEPKPGHVSSMSASSRIETSSRPASLSPPVAPGSATSNRRSPSPNRDYRNSAEAVVGVHPSVSRPPSPNPPTAAFMVPKPSTPITTGRTQVHQPES